MLGETLPLRGSGQESDVIKDKVTEFGLSLEVTRNKVNENGQNTVDKPKLKTKEVVFQTLRSSLKRFLEYTQTCLYTFRNP